MNGMNNSDAWRYMYCTCLNIYVHDIAAVCALSNKHGTPHVIEAGRTMYTTMYVDEII
jgi:hypothetical protein